MRVPLPIALVLIIALVGGLWWARTKDMDFMTPTGRIGNLPEFVTRPYDSSPAPDLPAPVARAAEAGETDRPPAEPSQNSLEFGDLASSPGLAEYSEHVPKGAAFLSRLAVMLETQGEFQRALLAWERVIDSTDATHAELEQAGDALERLQPNLPHWNIDPEGDLNILLQFGTTRPHDETFNRVAQDVADFLRQDSSDIVAVIPRITTSHFPEAPAQSPIAIYLTGPSDGESAQSNVLSINPPPDDPAAIRRDILQVVYRLVQARIATLEGVTIPQAATYPEEPERDFKRRLTRLHWKYFADSLVRPITPTAAAPTDGESSGPPESTDPASPETGSPRIPTESPPPRAAVVEPE